MYIAVYGTLREGESRFDIFEQFGKIKSKKIVTLSGFKMFDLEEYPAAFETNNEDDKIVVELINFEPTDRRAERTFIETLDWIEGVHNGYYLRKYIEIDNHKVLIYVMNPVYFNQVSRYNVITDWVKERGNNNAT